MDKMMIGFISATAVAAIGGYINFRLMIKKIEKDKELEFFKLNKQKEIAKNNVLEEKRVAAVKNLKKFRSNTSLHHLNLTQLDRESSLKHLIRSYEASQEAIAEIYASVELYFPTCSKCLEDVEIQAGYYWGKYADYLIARGKNLEQEELFHGQLVDVSLSCDEAVTKLKNMLKF